MATSRTGTTRWKNLAAKAKRHAIHQGHTNCPICGVPMNFQRGRTPTSAEVDHILPHSRGGTDTIDNVRVICRQCNQRRGNGLHRPKPKTKGVITVAPTATTNTW